jgi:hypothetical protein
MSIEVMRQVRNALVWNLNTDLDNIPACDQWAKMLRKNIDALDKAITDAELKWAGLTDEEIWEAYMKAPLALDCGTDELYALSRTVEAKLKEKNT